jgi:glutamate-5-semialdehyde dehydrogenase
MAIMSIKEQVHSMKMVAPTMAACSIDVRNGALAKMAEMLEQNSEKIFEANAKDMAAAEENGIAESTKKRLKFNEGKLSDCIEGLKQLQKLPDPIGAVQIDRMLDDGLELKRVSCPIGVIGVIFEARPDALIQISSLCIKSGNCAILKGGKETANTNRVLFEIIYKAAIEAGLPEHCLLQAEQHSEIDELLSCDEDVDLLIPRGSNKFVRYIMENTKIPVMGHSSGICHVYVDKAADQELAVPVVVDSKIQYAAACNACETLLVARPIAREFLPKVAKALRDSGVKIRGTQEVADIVDCEVMPDEEFSTEYGNLTISMKVVEDVVEAVDHINKYGSHHTDSIITEDDEAASYFMEMVDSAGVYRNCSTRFADGFRYGFGAEVGISTGKIHARGPVGLEGLTTYKYELVGTGNIVGDYASGKRSFHFKDLI